MQGNARFQEKDTLKIWEGYRLLVVDSALLEERRAKLLQKNGTAIETVSRSSSIACKVLIVVPFPIANVETLFKL